MSAQSIALLQADYTALAKEAGRRHSDVRDAADKASQVLKTAKDQALRDAVNVPEPPLLYQPIFLASATRNAKVIALAVSALQRLITAGAVPPALIGQILTTLEQVLPQGVEIQLKILQTLVSLLTTKASPEKGGQPLVKGEDLGQALELSHRLSTSKIPVVASTASATLRQLFMFVYDRIVDEDTLVVSSRDPDSDPAVPRATFDVDVPPLEEDRAALITSRRSIDVQDPALNINHDQMRSIKLRPAARDAYLLLEDLCLLIAGSVEGGPDGEPSFLRWSSLSRTFGLELVESIVSGFGPVVRTHPELLLVLRAHLCPLLIRFLSSPPSSSSHPTFSFPLTLRLTRVVFLLLKQFSDLLTLEAEVFLTMFVRIIAPASTEGGSGAGGEGGHPAGPGSGTSPLWMRVLALEIFRGLCGDFELMMKFYQRYDAAAASAARDSKPGKGKSNDGGSGSEGSTVFSDLMTAFNRLATEKPAVLGTGSAVLYGSSMEPPTLSHHHLSGGNVSSSNLSASGGHASGGTSTGSAMIDSAMEMGLGLAHAAGSVVGSGAASVGLHAATAVSTGLDTATASMKLQCIDQLDKADPPVIPETYIFLLALQCLAALADGFSTFTLTTYSTILSDRAKSTEQPLSKAPAAIDWTEASREDNLIFVSLRIAKEMAETSWPALLACLSFYMATSLSDELFVEVISALQSFACVCGVLNLSTPREAFLTSLCKFAVPPTVVSHIASQDSLQQSKPTVAASAAATATAVLSAGAESLGLTSSSTSLPVGLSSRNLACLRALLAVSHYLAGSLGKTWFSVFEALQNADFVLKATALKSKKRSTTMTTTSIVPGTPSGKAGGSSQASTASSAGVNGGGDSPEATKFPAIPTEADEQSVQRSIASLFEVSKSLEDEAFKDFVGALCRLNGEMVGMGMNDDGTVKDTEEPRSGISSPLDTPEKNRRRSSGISTKTQKLAEKSFGIAKLGVVALFNVQRLVTKVPDLGWNLVTSHLLLVLHSTSIPTSIRLQAADVLDSILILAPKNLFSLPLDTQHRAQTQVLAALASQAEPSPRLQTSTDVDIRRMALESLLKILETNGHAFVAGWDRIFHVLRTACPTSQTLFAPTSPQPPPSSYGDSSRRSLDTIVESDRVESMTPLRSGGGAGGYFSSERSAKTSVLVRTSFPSLQLICSDFLGGLAVEDLRDCIGTLAEFGKQIEDVNVALTAGGLLWSVSDHVQAKRRKDESEDRYGNLWMFLLHQLLSLCCDSRQEVRDAAITNIFRSISMYGTTLSKETWQACCLNIVFPLAEDVTLAIRSHAQLDDQSLIEEDVPTVPQVHGPPIRLLDKQWDDSKTLVLRSMGDIFSEYLPQIVKTDRYEETWSTFVGHLRQSFVQDRATPATAAMQALEKVLTVSLESTEADRITSSWEVAWSAWEEIGSDIERNSASVSSEKHFTQVNLEAFVRAALPIYTPPYISFDLSRISRLLAVLKSVLTYSRSPDYRADIDGLMPLQAAILEVIAVIKLDEVPGSASAVLSDLSDYLTLAYIAPYHAQPDASGRAKPAQSITFVALTKEVMPHVLWLYQKHRDDCSIYENGAVAKMLSAYALPMRVKHGCPAPAKFGTAEPLWRTATVDFLNGVREVVSALRRIGKDLSSDRFIAIWRAITEGFRGALLAETTSDANPSLEALHEEENFDLSLLIALEQDVLPNIGASRVPDELIRSIGKTLQLASRMYELDLPQVQRERTLAHKSSFISTDGPVIDHTPPPTPPEARFDPDFDRQARCAVKGTTVEVVEVGRERYAYWAFDLLFLMCFDGEQDHNAERRRIAALCLPSLLNRCASILKTYTADAPLRGKLPFPRVRQEELVYVLQKLTSNRLREGTLWASTQPDPSYAAEVSLAFDASLPLTALIRSTLLRSPLAHLYELHPLLTALLSLSQTTPTIGITYLPYRCTVGRTESGDISHEGLPHGFKVVKTGQAPADDAASDALTLVLRGLSLVGQDIGAGQLF